MCYNVNQEGEQLELDFSSEFKVKPHKRVAKEKVGYHLNGFAHPQLLVLANDLAELQEMEWGLVPFWVKSPDQAADIANKTLNAKSETIFELPSFRAAILKRRCIIPVSGFYEWRHYNKKTYPYYIYPKSEGYFRMGGIWEEWLDKESGEIKRTCSIITTAANPLMEQIHNTKKRMPLILDHDAAVKWLSNDIKKEEIRELMAPFDYESMDTHTISRLITSRSEDSNVPEVLIQEAYEELPKMEVA
ncbi:SOS response-associated peptidase [Algoriphagus resistens]|uniref:SOS response-associated peptidase n=1 Tax=Algoriphagus resistens TaxID=1750590 RepID=UPI000716C758|nr:SOS response-associated peptidase [Algoriphagus resistens]